MAPEKTPENEPTPEQLEAAIRAGWNPADGEPPVGWDGHTLPPEDDPELGNNGVPPPGPDEPVYVEGPVVSDEP